MRESIAQQELRNNNHKMQKAKRTCEVSEVFLIFHPFHLSAHEALYRKVSYSLIEKRGTSALCHGMLLTTHKGVEYCTRRRTRIINVIRSNRIKRRGPVKRRMCLVCARKEKNIPPYNDMIMLTIHEGNKRSPPPNLREECNRCISEELS